MKLEILKKIIEETVTKSIKKEIKNLREEIVDLISENNRLVTEDVRILDNKKETRNNNKLKEKIRNNLFKNQNIDGGLRGILNETLESMNDDDILNENDSDVKSVIESDNIPGNLSKIFNRDYSQILKKTEKFSGGSKNFRP